MKKSVLILLTFVPHVVGYIVNISISVPVIGMAIFYIVPLLTFEELSLRSFEEAFNSASSKN